MKIQDLVFVGVLLFVFIIKKPRLTAGLGLVFILLSIPLFARHIFFTAERLVYYAAALFLISVIIFLFKER